MTDILQTSIGPAIVLHRLALAIECRDALSDLTVSSPVAVRYRRHPPAESKPSLKWGTLSRTGVARFTLRHRIPDAPHRALQQLEVLVDDPDRRYVPRRFTVTPWTYADVKEPAAYIRTHARLLRLWLQPGSAYGFPRTATLIRGRVALQGGEPVRWARIEGTTPFSLAGWAHADERGEFVLSIRDPGYDPVRDTRLDFDVTLNVVALQSPLKSDPRDRTADLVSEVIPRSSNPPQETDLDNDLLRGVAVPPGYVANTAPARQVTIPVGAAFNLTGDVVFAPPKP